MTGGVVSASQVGAAVLLCQWGNEFPGPVAALCRLAWRAGVQGVGFDAEGVATEWWKGGGADRDRVVGLLEFVFAAAVHEAELWRIPDDPGFVAADWFGN